MPTDFPSASAKRKAQAQARTDNITLVLIWVIIWLGILVLGLLLADQSFQIQQQNGNIFSNAGHSADCDKRKSHRNAAKKRNVWIRSG